jgi:hypothetical protein
MILIDTGPLVGLLVGLIDIAKIDTHKRTSGYSKQAFRDLLAIIGSLERLVVLPNVWTEADNLLNKFTKSDKDRYIWQIAEVINSTTEKFMESVKAVKSGAFYDLGLTDSLYWNTARNATF